jgi:hypothetical protein
VIKINGSEHKLNKRGVLIMAKLKLSKRGISESKKYQEMKIDENR